MELSEFTVLRKGIDSLDVAFQGAIALEVREHLREVKARATSNGRAEYAVINGVHGHVGETGASGGYAFRFDTGPDGEIWTIKDNPDPQEWNIRVSVANAQLAVNGYHETKAALWARLEAFGARVVGESVSRADFAVDFVAPDFVLDAALLSCHWKSQPLERGDFEGSIPVGGSEFLVASYRRQTSSVTVGMMPRRQVQIYNKSLEVSRKIGSHWYEVWGVDKDDCPPVWRVELRAGKDHLKEWKITTFEDLETRMASMWAAACQGVRLMKYSPDDGENVTRVPDHALWEILKDEVKCALVPFLEKADRKRVVEGRREDIQKMYKSGVMGWCVSYAVAMGETPSAAAEAFADVLADEFRAFARDDPKHFKRKMAAADERLFFLDEPGERAPF